MQTQAGTDKQLYGIFHPARTLSKALRAAHRPADVTNAGEMREVFAWAKPDVVVHAAAIGSVDFAEKHQAQTHAVNVGGTTIVAACCKDFGARLIYISSNAVFDGTRPLYSETDPVSPINYYGQLKVEAERITATCGVPCAIVRPILLYGWPYPDERGNLVTTWVKALREHQPQSVVDNVYSKPLPARACADAVWAIVNRNCSGNSLSSKTFEPLTWSVRFRKCHLKAGRRWRGYTPSVPCLRDQNRMIFCLPMDIILSSFTSLNCHI